MFSKTMGFNLSGGPYTYNRFDAFEQGLEEGSGASNPQEMKKEVEEAGKKNKAKGKKLAKEDEKEEAKGALEKSTYS